MSITSWQAVAAAVVLLWGSMVVAQSPPKPNPLANADSGRVVFLGDSLTYDGRYAHYIEAYYLTAYPNRTIEFINLGLPSETITGLSEPDHPFPRPNAHERLGRVLEQLKPDVVIACYGMNDGIYYPLARDRFENFKQGIEQLIAKVAATGASIYILTPPPFDSVPVSDKARGDSADAYSWHAPYIGYDQVMAAYSQWLLTKNDPRVARVIDTRTPTLAHLNERRKTDPAFTLAADGVHCNALGQWLIAAAFLDQVLGPTTFEATFNIAELADPQGVVNFSVTTQLAVIDPAWDEQDVKLNTPSRLRRCLVRFTNPKAASYQLFEDQALLGAFDRQALKDGIRLNSLKGLAARRRMNEMLALIAQRQQLIGRAWLTQIGHKRPDTPPGESLDSAQPRADALHQQARALAAPIPITLRLVPVK